MNPIRYELLTETVQTFPDLDSATASWCNAFEDVRAGRLRSAKLRDISDDETIVVLAMAERA